MTPTEMYDIIDQHPDRPIKLTLSSGDVVVVDNPRRTIIQELALYIGQADDPDAPFAQRIRVVSIPNIAMVEHIDRSQLRGRSRRRGA